MSAEAGIRGSAYVERDVAARLCFSRPVQLARTVLICAGVIVAPAPEVIDAPYFRVGSTAEDEAMESRNGALVVAPTLRDELIDQVDPVVLLKLAPVTSRYAAKTRSV